MRAVRSKEITYNKFLKMVDDGKVKKVEIQSDKIMIVTKKDKDSGISQEYYTGVVNDDELTNRLEKAGVEFNQEIRLDDKAYVKRRRHDGNR